MKKFLSLLFLAAIFSANQSHAQVTVTDNAGNPLRNYTNLRLAFDAINNGLHQGDILVEVSANTDEGNIPATLHSGDSDPCSYTSVIIRPTAIVTVSGNPGTGFGVIQLNGADNVIIDGDAAGVGGTQDLTIQNTSASSLGFTSVIRVATSSAVLSADNISIQNINIVGNVTAGNGSTITSATSSSSTSFGIYVGGNGGTAPLSNPTAINNVTTNPAPAGTIIKGFTASNNIVTNVGRGIVFNSESSSVSTGITISGNTIGAAGSPGAFPYTGITSTVYAKGIWVAGTDAASIQSNTIRNLFSYVATNIVGIELAAEIGGGTVDITNNTLTTVASNTTTATTVDGILVNAASGQVNISSNTLTTLTNTSARPVSGVRINTDGGIANITHNKIIDVYARNTGGYGAKGINIGMTETAGVGLAANGCIIQNNFISNIRNSGNISFTNNLNTTGILLYAGNDHKIYHNSVNLFGAQTSSSANVSACLSVNAATQTGIDARNNIFANTITTGSTSDANVCVFLPFTAAAAANMNLTLNHNAYYTGSTANQSGIAFAGGASYAVSAFYTAANFIPNQTIAATNWRSWITLVGPITNDYASFASTAAAPFVNSGTGDLHITGGATQLESGGFGGLVTNDIDFAARNATTPDIGADEFAGTTIDFTAPLITYTPLTSTCAAGNRTLIANITDRSGVPTAGTGLPMLYFRINAGAWTGVQGVSGGGGNYSFTFGGGAVLNDVIQYYIVARDAATTPNIIASPVQGATGYTFDPPAVTTIPTTLESYAYQPSLAGGTYTVGAAGNYPTLTAAVNAYNNSCLGGPIIFELIDVGMSGSEVFPISINRNATASAVNTLTIRPASGVNVVWSGNNAQALIKLNGADYVTINGVNSSSPWSLRNSNTGTSATVIWISSSSTLSTDGATNNTITNMRLWGASQSQTIACVLAGSGTSFGSSATAQNNNNTITGNLMNFAQNGIYINGSTSTNDQNWIITNNTIGSTAEKMGYRGLSVQRVNTYTISGNVINSVELSSASPATGIAIFNNATNGQIFNNRISAIRQNSSTGGAYGIYLDGSSNSANVDVYNNFIWGVSANGSATLEDNSFGINITDGGGYDIYYNSVSMNLPQTTTSGTTAAIRITNGVTTSGALNVRNNIFSNTQSQDGTRLSILNQSTASIFSTINYNNYYFPASSFLGILGTTTRATLNAWQTATGQDTRSVSTNPVFVNPASDLHLAATSPLNALGQAIATFTTDIDGDTRDGSTPDMGADEFVPAPCVAPPVGGTISSPVASFCVSGSTTLSATGFTTGTGMSYQWEYSTTGGAPWNVLTGQNIAPNALTGNITVTTYYRLRVTCSGNTAYSNIISIEVNNAAVTQTTPGTRCGPGEVDLFADGTGDINWYSTSTGGISLYTGTNFTTPILPVGVTTYYVSASAGGTVNSNVPSPPVGTTGFHTATVGWGLRFTVNQQVTINTVDMYPRGASAGPASIQIIIRDNSDVILYTGPVHNFTVGTTHALQVVPVGLTIPPGVNYKMTMVTTGINNVLRNLSGASYPYSVPELSITSASNGGGATTSLTTYYWFYNWSISTGCESARTAITATVTPPPAMTQVATPATICAGETSTLSVSSSNAGYSYQWMPGSLSGASVNVTPATTTTYTVTALDISGGANNGCRNEASVTVSVNALPSVVTVAPVNPAVCAGASVNLTASGGTVVTSATIGTGTVTNSANSTTNLPPYGGFWTGNKHQMLYLASELTAQGLTGGSVINSLGFDVVSYGGSIANMNGFGIRMGHTNVTALTSTFLTSPMTTVFNPVNFPYPTPGWSVHNFNTNFVWDGTSNIVVETWFSNCQACGAGTTCNDNNWDDNAVIRQTTFSTVYHTFYNSDGQSCNIQTQPSASGTTGVTLTRPNIRFGIDNQVAMTWTPSLGLNTTTGPTVIASPTQSTMYTATATNSAGCTRKDSTLVTINTALISAVTVDTICANQNATIRVTFTGGGTWNFTYTANGGSPVNVTGISTSTYDITVNPTVSTTYQITAASNGTCNIAAAALPATAVINVYPVPTVNALSTPTAICEGGSATLSVSGTAGTYTWAGPGLSATTGSSVTATPPGTGTIGYSVTLDEANGCQTTVPLSLTVNPNLPVSVTVSPSANPVCTGSPVTFTATAVNEGTGTPYQWQVNGGNVGGPTASNTYVYNPADGDIVTVIVTSNATCATGTPATSADVVMSVQGTTTASVSLAASGPLCAGNDITFTATPTGGGTTPNFEFFVEGISVQSSTTPTYTYAAVNGDDVYVIMTSDLACAVGSPATSSTITVSFFAAPTTGPTATCTSLMAGNSTTLSANATAGSGAISGYQWQLGGVDIGGATGATYTTTVPGSYTVVITNSNGCTTTSSPLVITNITGPLPGGTYTIDPSAPGCNNFTSIANAAAYINQYGIGGTVFFDVPGGYTETALQGGIVIGSATLNASLNAGRTLTFRKSGAGANPLVTAYTPQVTNSFTDAVIKIVGADYVTFDAIDVQENAANSTTGIMTEFGYGIFYITQTDGAQNNTIQNATITMNRFNNSFGIYSTSRHSSTSITLADASSAAGNNDNLKVYGNTISNVNTGVVVISPPAFPGTGADIGGTAPATGNTITEFGTLNTNITSLPSGNSGGILAGWQAGINVSYNTITSSATAAVSTNLRGIYAAATGMTYPGSGNYDQNFTNNNISLKTTTAGNVLMGIHNEVGNALVDVVISNNNFHGFEHAVASPTGAVFFINNTGASLTQTINANTFTNMTLATTGSVTFIGNAVALPINGVQTVSDNSIVTQFSKTGGGGIVAFLTSGASVTSSQAIITHNNNNFSNVTLSGPSPTTLNAWLNTDVQASNKTFSNNTFNNITNSTTGAVVMMRISANVNSPGLFLDNNTLSNISVGSSIVLIEVPLAVTGRASVTNNDVINITTPTTALISGINVGSWLYANVVSNVVDGINSNGAINGLILGSASGGVTHLVDQNIITNLVNAGTTGTIVGLTSNATGAILSNNTISTISSAAPSGIVTGLQTSQSSTIFGNEIHTLSASGTTNPFVNGMLLGTGTISAYKNRIYNLSFTGSFNPTSGAVSGIQFNGGAGAATVYNNFISDLKAPASQAENSVRGIHIFNSGSNAINLYYNTIFLNASGTTNFAATGIYHQTTVTTAVLTMRNNIISNESAPSGSGRTVAYRRFGAISANYSTASNNNLLYAGVPSANNLIYFDGTNGDQTLTDFQARMVNRDLLSLSHQPAFINSTAAPYDLHLDPDGNCSLDGGGDNSGILISDDYDGDARSVVSPFITDIGADEFNGTGGTAGVWKGINEDWMDVVNWCDAVPTANTNVTIPTGLSFYPIITTTEPVAKSLTIVGTGSITIEAGGQISLKGDVVNGGTITNNGTILLNGTTVQNFPGAAGTIAAMNTLEVNNSAGMVLNKPIIITGALLPTLGTITLGNNKITLASSVTATARIGVVGTTDAFVYNGTGRFEVQRYINTGTGAGQHAKSWQLLATPAYGQTINAAWQEGSAPTVDNNPGFGTIITSDLTNATTLGFDFYTQPGPSLKLYNPVTDNYDGLPNTTSTEIANKKGYMILVRGPRSVQTYNAPAAPTIMRITGKVYAPGVDAPASSTIPANLFESVGNPYASAINPALITKTASVQDFFYVWDPTLNSFYGLGGWNTLVNDGSDVYYPLLNTTYYPSTTPVNIQSGQAFLVRAITNPGTVSFTEAAKVAGSATLLRPGLPAQKLRANLFANNAIIDGNYATFSTSYTNGLDFDDARKVKNGAENFGIINEGENLIIEARKPANNKDTIFYRMWNMRSAEYELRFVPENMQLQPGLTAYLEDLYLETATVVSMNDSTFYKFRVNGDQGSYAPDRFRIVFKRKNKAPLITIKAHAETQGVQVNWDVEGDNDITSYQVVRSGDGKQFTTIGTSDKFSYLDMTPFNGTNFYKIRGLNEKGEVTESERVKVEVAGATLITVYPNPVGENKLVNIDIQSAPRGRYEIALMNAAGEVVLRNTIQHAGKQQVYPLQLKGMLTHGTYMIAITGEDRKRSIFRIVY